MTATTNPTYHAFENPSLNRIRHPTQRALSKRYKCKAILNASKSRYLRTGKYAHHFRFPHHFVSGFKAAGVSQSLLTPPCLAACLRKKSKLAENHQFKFGLRTAGFSVCDSTLSCCLVTQETQHCTHEPLSDPCSHFSTTLIQHPMR